MPQTARRQSRGSGQRGCPLFRDASLISIFKREDIAIKYFFHTFGCRVNQYETETLREKLLDGGPAAHVEKYDDADLCVINTCTVTREADKDALRLIRRISTRNPAARLVVTGCFATRDPREILDAAPDAVVVGNDKKDSLPAMLGCRPAPDFPGITEFHNHSRAFVKVQDGCNMHCTYCIIPAVRPKLLCKPYEKLEAEVRGLIESGTQEIVLCGVRLGRYQVEDASGRRADFVGMLDRLSSLPGDYRIRLSSFEITDVTDRFLDLFESRKDKICQSLHIPLQSGSNAVLKRMERWYSAEFYARRIAALKARCPDVGLFADVMAGFPGESEAFFNESVDFIKAIGYSGLHVFRFSKRPGTPAARFRNQVPEQETARRSQFLRDLDREIRSEFAKKSVGSRRRVLVESRRRAAVPPFAEEPAEGLTDHFLRVQFASDPPEGLTWANISSARGALAVATID